MSDRQPGQAGIRLHNILPVTALDILGLFLFAQKEGRPDQTTLHLLPIAYQTIDF